jgi:hypothetical protein
MRQLTFEGYLKKCLNARSDCKSSSLKKLSEEACSRNSHLREPLILYAFFIHDKDSINRLFRCNPNLIEEYDWFYSEFGSPDLLMQTFRSGNCDLPESYQNIYKEYTYLKNRKYNEYITKSLIKRKILTLQSEKNVTDYRIYTSLRINPGNFNAFMKHDRYNKLSLDIIENMLDYLENIPEKNLEVQQPRRLESNAQL